MKIINTATFDADAATELERLCVYNGLDCCLTQEIKGVLQGQMDKYAWSTYRYQMALQGPVLDMMFKGILIDLAKRNEMIRSLEREQERCLRILNKLAIEVMGSPLNPASPKQCQELFYGALNLPPIYPRGKKKGKNPTTDNEALEKLKAYFFARPFCHLIITYRDLGKLLGSLKAKLGPGNRMFGKFSVAGTETGRFSASKSNFGEGLNLQNQTERVKRMYVADPGMKLAYIDLEQAESRIVGLLCYALFGEANYLDACEAEDLHTTVCRMVWPQLPWTGDIKKDRRTLADQIFFRHFSYRDMAKRGGHGSNYFGKPPAMARNLNVDQVVMEGFQAAYFSAFPEIPEWHEWTRTTIQKHGMLITPFGRKRIFFSRTDQDSTLREAIAYIPQSAIGDLMNLGMYKVWQKFPRTEVQLLAQVHDAILIQYPEEREDEIIPEVLKTIPHPLYARGREVIIPCEAETGWNWAKNDPKRKFYSDENPDGLKEYKGHDSRERTEQIPTQQSLLASTTIY